MGLPERIYTKDELEVARTKGQVIGWIQGAAVVVLGGMVLKLVLAVSAARIFPPQLSS